MDGKQMCGICNVLNESLTDRNLMYLDQRDDLMNEVNDVVGKLPTVSALMTEADLADCSLLMTQIGILNITIDLCLRGGDIDAAANAMRMLQNNGRMLKSYVVKYA